MKLIVLRDRNGDIVSVKTVDNENVDGEEVIEGNPNEIELNVTL